MAARWMERGMLTRKYFRRLSFTCVRHQQVGPAAKHVKDIELMLLEPSWSVNSLFTSHPSSADAPVSKKQLHHLLRLSALPLPADEAEEAKMLEDLGSQLHFVRAIQEVDTDGVEPLVSLRDETVEAAKESEVTVDTLKEDFAKETVTGTRGRITTSGRAEKEDAEDWDALACAPKTVGRYIALDNKASAI